MTRTDRTDAILSSIDALEAKRPELVPNLGLLRTKLNIADIAAAELEAIDLGVAKLLAD